MVCEYSVNPPTDFDCNATTAIDQQEVSLLSMENADMVGSLRPASFYTNSTQSIHSFLATSLVVMAIVAGVVLGSRRRRGIRSVGVKDDNEQHETAMHPTMYNSI